MEVDKKSKQLLTISTGKGALPVQQNGVRHCFGPSDLATCYEQDLQGIPKTHATQDDKLVSGSIDQEHMKSLSEALKRLRSYRLKANLQKCSFFQDCIVYCGYKISIEGLRKTKENIRAVLDAPAPQNVSQLRSFLGLINDY